MRPNSASAARKGFSLVELLIATGVLGVGLTALVKMHTASVTGAARGEALTLAQEIAVQRAELFATMDPNAVPPCTGPATCRQSGGNDLADPLPNAGPFACTRWVDAADVPGASGNGQSGVKFRIDSVIAAHPDTIRQPRARVVTISVCWFDKNRRVREVQTRRMLVPGV